ncbi:ABC transporter substrate-binding protein [Pseudonocardia sp. GCM10023141]|uniref:ABC transporter substrate-binding protein n=1 Tax=Pseudonocardia sp. GCM10023141 TaxID=3252653 RepID=UPI00361E4282
MTVIAAVAALALQACGSGPGASGGGGGGTLSVLVAANGQYPDKQKAWFTQISDTFRKSTGAEVHFETFASAADEQKRIQTSVVSGEGPDIYSLGTTFTPVAFATGAFLQMGDADWKAVGGKDRFIPATLAISGPDDAHQVGIPFLSRPFVMAYNTKLFAEAGIAGPPTTWDELVADGKKLTKGDQFGMAAAYADNFDPWKFVWMFANQYGNPLVDGKKARLDDPTLQKAYDAYFGFLTKDHIVNPEAAGWNAAQSLASFATGKSAMILMSGPGAIPTLDTSAVKSDYAFAKMPEVPPGATALPAGGRPATTIVSGDNIAVASYTKNKDLALKFVELITSEAEQVNYTKTFGDLPTNVAAAKQITDTTKQLAPIIEAGKAAIPTPFTGAWSEVQLALTNIAVQSRPDLSAGGVSEAALAGRLAEAQKAAQTAVDRAGGQ